MHMCIYIAGKIVYNFHRLSNNANHTEAKQRHSCLHLHILHYHQDNI